MLTPPPSPISRRPRPSLMLVERWKLEVFEAIGFQIADDDISETDGSSLSAKYKFFELKYCYLVEAIHRLLVTGTRHFGPADMSTGHWLSNACRSDNERYYTRIEVGGVILGCHQIIAAGKFGRRRMIGTSCEKNSGGEKLMSKLCVSHLCHIQACLNPLHLTIESIKTNDVRNRCKFSNVCTGQHYGEFIWRMNEKCHRR